MRLHALALGLSISIACHASVPAEPVYGDVPAYIAKSVSDPARIPDSIAFDEARLPADVLSFARVRPGDIAVDLIPGQGYFTKLLSKVVGPGGKVYAVQPKFGASVLPTSRTDSPEIQQERAVTAGLMRAALVVANISSYKNVRVLGPAIDQYGGNFPLPEQADLIFTFDGYHDLHTLRFSASYNTKPLDSLAMSKAIFDAMTPGGLYIVADAAAAPGDGFTAAGRLGRIEKDAVRKEITAAGFIFEAESRALANPADSHMLPATDPLLGGRPDRFLLRFRKPFNSPQPNRLMDDAMASLYGNTIVYWNFCMTGEDGRKPICGLKATEHHLRYLADHTFQVNGLSGDDPLIQGTWFWDARGHVCMWGEYPSMGGVMCHVPNVGRKVGETWNARPYGVSQVMKTKLVPGFLRSFGTFTEADFPPNEN